MPPLGFLFRLLDDSAVQAFAFRFFDNRASHAFQDGFAFVGVAGVGQECGDQRGAGGCQWSARRPDVERGDVPVPHVLLVDGVERDLLEREGDFYEAFVVGWHRKIELSIRLGIFWLSCLGGFSRS